MTTEPSMGSEGLREAAKRVLETSFPGASDAAREALYELEHAVYAVAPGEHNDTGTRTQVPGGNPRAVRSGDSLVAAGQQVPGGNRVPTPAPQPAAGEALDRLTTGVRALHDWRPSFHAHDPERCAFNGCPDTDDVHMCRQTVLNLIERELAALQPASKKGAPEHG
jgi:hypothetical protein